MRTHGPLIAGRLPGPGTVLGGRGRSEVPKHVACTKKSRGSCLSRIGRPAGGQSLVSTLLFCMTSSKSLSL